MENLGFHPDDEPNWNGSTALLYASWRVHLVRSSPPHVSTHVRAALETLIGALSGDGGVPHSARCIRMLRPPVATESMTHIKPSSVQLSRADHQGSTPLHWAAWEGSEIVVKYAFLFSHPRGVTF